MSELPRFMLAFTTGILLGAIFFGGLWWTIRKGFSSEQPALWFSGSLLLRTFIAIAGFLFIARGDWRQLVVSLLGFVLARLLVARFTRLETGAS